MTDQDRLQLLVRRLRQLERTSVWPSQRAIREVGLRALETEISELGQRLTRRGGRR